MVIVPMRVSWAEHPLITDDTGTQGKGNIQLELNGEYGRDSSDGVVQHTTPTASTLTYGVNDSLDVSIGVPYEWIKTDGSGAGSPNGLGDVAVAAKWRFYENNGLSFAVKPGLTFPTGNKDKQLGTGRITYSLFFITTKEMAPWTVHLNLGYIANENDLDQRVPLWHASIASEVEVTKELRLVANTGIQRNTDKGSGSNPAFLLGGLIYTVGKNVDVDVGYKYGLTKPEVDHSFLAGITLRF
jgi:hypothetical protein